VLVIYMISRPLRDRGDMSNIIYDVDAHLLHATSSGKNSKESLWKSATACSIARSSTAISVGDGEWRRRRLRRRSAGFTGTLASASLRSSAASGLGSQVRHVMDTGYPLNMNIYV
jgi:hypothetical protein